MPRNGPVLMASLAGRLSAWRWRLTATIAGLGLSACLIDDPNHCANRQGDATCVELGDGAFCSICQAENNGCVSEQPQSSCHAPVMAASDETSTGQVTTLAESSGSEETGEPPECTAEGIDEACPEDAPYCVGGACSTCDVGADDLCASIDGATPVCHADWGQCVACIEDADCGDGSFCGDDYACGGCTRHSQCPDSACNIRVGECFSPDAVYWVDSGEPCPGFGTEDEPYCEFESAMTAIGVEQAGVVRLVAGGYGETLQIGGLRTVAIIGVGDTRPNIRNTDVGIRVTNVSTAYVQNVQTRDNTEDGIECSLDSRLWLDDVLVHRNATGIHANKCRKMVVRSSQVYLNTGDGIVLEDNSKLELRSSAVVRNGTAEEATRGIRVASSAFEITYSTVADNRGNPPLNINCTGGNGDYPIRNSIVVSPLVQSINCPWANASNSVIDTAGLDGQGQVIIDDYDPSWFVDVTAGNVHIGSGQSSPFFEAATWQLGDPRFDLDQDPRAPAPGTPEYAGADQP